MVLKVEACQKHAAALLEDQPDNEDAAIMLAELMAHQVGVHDDKRPLAVLASAHVVTC